VPPVPQPDSGEPMEWKSSSSSKPAQAWPHQWQSEEPAQNATVPDASAVGATRCPRPPRRPQPPQTAPPRFLQEDSGWDNRKITPLGEDEDDEDDEEERWESWGNWDDWEEDEDEDVEETPKPREWMSIKAGEDEGKDKEWNDRRNDDGDWKKTDSREWTDEEWKEWKERKWGRRGKDKDKERDRDKGEGMCQDFKRGKCWRGKDCRFKHEGEEDEEEDCKWDRRGGKGKGKGKGKDKGKDKGKKKKRRRGDGPDEDDAPEKYGETWEEPRETSGLALIGDAAPKQIPWSYVLLDESRRSFAGMLPCPFSEAQCEEFMNLVWDGTEWDQPKAASGVLVPRKTAWMVKRGCTCSYQYGGLDVPPQEFPPFMIKLLEATMPLCGLSNRADWPDSCNLNLYEDGGMSVGWHSDDERLFQGKFNDIQIISLSFGVTRKFELRANWPEAGERRTTKISLGSGDIMTMEGMTQKHFQHRVPKEDNIDGPRINLTWRWVLKHSTKCPAARQHGR